MASEPYKIIDGNDKKSQPAAHNTQSNRYSDYTRRVLRETKESRLEKLKGLLKEIHDKPKTNITNLKA